MQDFNEKLKQNAKYIFLHKLITPAINVVITIYIVKKLSIIDYGIYNLLYGLIGYLTLFSSMGLLNVFQRFIPEYYTKKEYSKVKILVNYGTIIRLILAIIFIAIILIIGNPINHLFKINNFIDYIQFFCVGIVIFLEVQLIEVTLNALFLNKYIMISYLLSTLARAGLTYWLLEIELGLKGLLLAETVYFIILMAIHGFFYCYGFASNHASADKSIALKRLLRYGGFSYLDELGWTILDVKTDFFIISTFLGPTMVGLYAFANQIVESVSKVMPDKIVKPLIRTVFFSKFSTANSTDHLNRDFNFLIKLISFISFPLLLTVMTLGDKIIIYLFDLKYLPALHLLWIFTGFMLIISFQFPLQLVVQATEKVEITFVSKIFSIYNLIGDLLVVQLLGLLGVALVTCSARLFQNIFIFYRIKKFAPLHIDLTPLLKIFLNAVLTITVLYMFRNFVDNIFSLVICSIGGLLIYLLLSYLNKSFFQEEREKINALLPCPIFVF